MERSERTARTRRDDLPSLEVIRLDLHDGSRSGVAGSVEIFEPDMVCAPIYSVDHREGGPLQFVVEPA